MEVQNNMGSMKNSSLKSEAGTKKDEAMESGADHGDFEGHGRQAVVVTEGQGSEE